MNSFEMDFGKLHITKKTTPSAVHQDRKHELHQSGDCGDANCSDVALNVPLICTQHYNFPFTLRYY